MLKFFQARPQQLVNWELPDVGLEKTEKPEIKLQHLLDHKESKGIPENIYFFIDYTKAFDCVDHNKLWKILREMGIPNHFTCLLRNLYVSQEATVRSNRIWNNWLVQNWERSMTRLYIVTCLFNFYAEYIMRNAGLDASEAGIKIAGRNINNLRYADDTTLLQKVKRKWRASWWGWKRRVKKLAWSSAFKKLRSWHLAPSLHGKQKGKKWKQQQILFSWAPKALWMVTAAIKLKDTYSLEGKLWQTLTAY